MKAHFMSGKTPMYKLAPRSEWLAASIIFLITGIIAYLYFDEQARAGLGDKSPAISALMIGIVGSCLCFYLSVQHLLYKHLWTQRRK